jgi:hypothetical protein
MIQITLKGVTRIADAVWEATIPPDQLTAFGAPSAKIGPVTVLSVLTESSPERDSESVSFRPGEVHLLNAGATARALLVFAAPEPAEVDADEIDRYKYGPAVWNDDDKLLQELSSLPAELAEAGKSLLQAIRAEHPGFFQRTRVGRFVNRPNNFWTIKVQPQDRSLRITLRGDVTRFDGLASIDVKPDRKGYSNLKVSTPAQVPDAVAAIHRASAV